MTSKRKQLDLWAEHLHDREIIGDFLEWLCENDKYSELAVFELRAGSILDEYHGIDQKKLDEERRALLEEFVQSQKE